MSSDPLSCISDDQLRSFKKTFNHFAKKGEMKPEDLPNAFKMLGIKPTDDEIREMLEEIGNETPIDLIEFTICVYYFLRGADSQEELINAFKIFDKKNEGKLPAATITKILTSLKHPVSQQLIDDTLKQLDTDGKHMIDYAEMIRMMRPN